MINRKVIKENNLKKPEINPKFPGLVNQFIRVRGLKISLWSFGEIDPSRITLFCLPGWPFSGYVLWPMGFEFRKKIQFIAIDIPGLFGYSSKPDYTVNGVNTARILSKIPEILGIKKFGIFGTSGGGFFSVFTFLQMKKEALRDKNFAKPQFLILHAPALNGPKISFVVSPKITQQTLNEIRKRGRIASSIENIVKNSFGKMFLKETLYKRASSELKGTSYWKFFTYSMEDQTSGFSRSAIVDVGRDLLKEDRSELLKKVDVPTLLIEGDQDDTVYIQEVKRMLDFVKDGELREIKNGGHRVILTHPKEMAKVILSFFEDFSLLKSSKVNK